MNKKGFTLIELLGTIVILTLLALLIIPAVNDIINSSKEQVSDSNILTILKAAYSWSLDEDMDVTLPVNNNESISVTLLELKTSGHLKKETIDALTGAEYSDSCVVTITKKAYTGSNVQNNHSKYYGNYLYSFSCD